ncbi:hypothetical protein NQ314_014397 [Rhamnusium bicolor]|uniref:PiggyBac transposable element-derived protein domain-containing protein n=1 Tax=Rhamnusium bicolor TaxID=1586634 RepID=A0AAV8X286_9CUCU|nr:hypothetical protein NQ314_014397 [Rhamnusium bicolor]
MPNCPFPDIKEIKKSDRGHMLEFVTEMDGIPITSVIWKDNKPVSLISTYTGILPQTKVERSDRSEKKKIQVDCSNLVREYNRHMGGVDLLDSLIGRYRIKIKSRKWYMRLFYHILDMAVVNSWLLYKRLAAQNGNKNSMALAEFRIEIGQTLCMLGVRETHKRGRKSDLEKQLQESRRSSSTAIPPKGVRLDQTSHWPMWMEKRLRCKYPDCKGFTYVLCEKCSAALCFNKNKNCFWNFHK